MPDPQLAYAIPLLVLFALLAALEVDSLKRGFSGALDWFGILTFGLVAFVVVGTLDRRSYVNGMSPQYCASCSGISEVGFQPSFHLGTHSVRDRALTVLWIALVRPARRSNRRADPQLGRGRHAALGTRHDDLAALSRFAAQLSLDGREAGDAHAAGSRLRGEPQSRRSRSARCSIISRTSRRCARKSSRSTIASALLVQYGRQTTRRRRRPPDGSAGMGWAPARRRHRALRPLLRKVAVKFFDEATIEVIAGDGGNGVGLVPAREIRAARRPRRRRRRTRRQHLRGRRPQHQHADRLSLRAHPSRQARRERPRRRPVRAAAPTTSCCACRSAPVITDADTGELDRRSRERRRARAARAGRQGRPRQHPFQVEHQPRAAPVHARATKASSAGSQLELQACWPTSACSACPTRASRTLIRAISAARPKVADYPFTTLAPEPRRRAHVRGERSFVVADIPGLIEGAADGAGLGHQFLRHLQRTRLLLHLVDLAAVRRQMPIRCTTRGDRARS